MPSEPAAFDYTKYEGHMKGPWAHSESSGVYGDSGPVAYGVWCNDSSAEMDFTSEANRNLVLDAPLLLSRCKALEEALQSIVRYADAADGSCCWLSSDKVLSIARAALNGAPQ